MMAALLAAVVLLLVLLTAVVSLPDLGGRLDQMVPVPRSEFLAIALVVGSGLLPSGAFRGTVFLVGIAMLLRPWVRRRFGLNIETRTITVAWGAFSENDIGSGLHLNDGKRWEITEVLAPNQVRVRPPARASTVGSEGLHDRPHRPLAPVCPALDRPGARRRDGATWAVVPATRRAPAGPAGHQGADREHPPDPARRRPAVGQEPTAVVLIATLPDGHRAAFRVDVPLTPEDLRRLAAIQSMPALAEATWTGQEGDTLR